MHASAKGCGKRPSITMFLNGRAVAYASACWRASTCSASPERAPRPCTALWFAADLCLKYCFSHGGPCISSPPEPGRCTYGEQLTDAAAQRKGILPQRSEGVSTGYCNTRHTYSYKMNSGHGVGGRDAAQTGHKRQVTLRPVQPRGSELSLELYCPTRIDHHFIHSSNHRTT